MSNILDGLNRKSTKKAQETVNNFQSWDDAISHTQARIKELQRSLKVFKENRKRSEPWPVTKKAGTERESIPA
jgi:hypothetical protein